MSSARSLYLFEGCPWCERVRAAIQDLDIDIEERNIREDDRHAAALKAAMGRGTVPVLRIDEAGGTRWIPESADIVAYLYAEHGEGKAKAFLASNWPQRIGFGLALALAAAAVATERPELGIAAAIVWLLGNRAPLARRWF